MRIVAIQLLQQWTAAIESQEFLQVPDTMDLQAEENVWLAAGGHGSGQSFAQHLISRGATAITVELWPIA